jgi:TrmH family RNA methyltransferase
VFLAEGVHLAQEALRCGAEVELAVYSERLTATDEGRTLQRDIERAGIPRARVEDRVLDSLQDAKAPQPVMLLVHRHSRAPGNGIDGTAEAPLVVAAVGIQDPGNLGGLLRTAEAAGATACCVTAGSADPFHPRAVRASAGAIFRLPVHLERESSLVERLRDHGLRLIAADARGGVAYDRCDLTGSVALLLGAEGPGLPAELRAAVDRTVHVPMHAAVDSLSVGAAAAVLLFEAARQRRARGGGVRSHPSFL